jgi:arginyl-tRNA synthetase
MGFHYICDKINIVVDIKTEIASVIEQSLANFTGAKINFLIEKPQNESFGDYSSNVALVASKILKKNPFDLANEIVKKLNNKLSDLPNIDKVKAMKPGFINFYLSEEYLFSQLEKILEQKEKFGSEKEDPNKKVVVEYSSPNIAKPFTVGHLRSTIIGDAIANLLVANGWKVYRDNHLGDWGTQFGKQIYAIKTWGNEGEIEKSENPVKNLVALYVKFHEEAEKNPELEEKAREWFKKLEDGDSEARRLWKKCVGWSLKEFKIIYEKLGVKFTENEGLGYGEAFFEDKMAGVIRELKKKGLLKDGEEGAKLIFFANDPEKISGQAKFPPLMILKQDGATLYATRDLATDEFRLEKYGKDTVIINEVGAEQSLYFNQLFESEKMLGWIKDGQRIHIKHGLYRFKDQKMSTRKGNAIWLEDVLDEAIKRAENLGSDKKVAGDVGIGALKWNDLKRTPQQDIVFNWDEILNMQGDSGPYIQYSYVRTQSVLSKSKNEANSAKKDSIKLEPEEISLLRALNNFPEVVQQAGEKFAPNALCNYLFDLAQEFNLFYQKHKIIGSEQAEFRLALTRGVGQVLKNGLNLLGIEAPNKM